ncbi:hypothetical protein MGYG_01267 [Nannizzia gypsea CBS 118893]|uniref:PHD-type domain-containing protein n=1 Tax=Arthroderma gypseum (strain ATCC MYA-4604 / CBS 118893) TaxID=535722 RepID=E5QZY3_ARTGP|nr:hypothetical protein MGYG_01267 [Nannizzia gypsea CBS 118893]EFQ98232.1 hypothetical protein MGYG_01267 [Nannizzia gypsea CBS 118893]
MGSNTEFATMPPPPMARFTTDTNPGMINEAQNTQILDMSAEGVTFPREGLDSNVSIPSMTYASSSSELSSVSSISTHEGFSSTMIATGDTSNINSKGFNLTPAKPELPLKYSTPLAGWRNIAPAPPPSTALPPSTAAIASAATVGDHTGTGGSTVPLVSTPKASPSKPAPRRRRTAGGAKPRTSRKSGRYGERNDDEGVIKAEDTDSDESSDAQLTTTQTKSGRQIHRPTMFTTEQVQKKSASPDANHQQPPRKRRRVYRKGKEVNVVCLRCDRGHSPRCNAIVFCDDCNAPWHQFCHDPPIGDDVISVKNKEWFCGECRPIDTSLNQTLKQNGQIHHQNDLRSSASPSMQASGPQTPTLLGGSQFTRVERKNYLSSLSHAALVNLLVNISDTRPDIPIFPANLNELNTSSFSSTASTISSSVAPNGSTGSSQQRKISGQPATSTPPSSKRPSESVPASTTNGNGENSDVEEVEEHRLYPRPGNGFRLPPDSEDIDMLLEDPSSTTFSHALHGPAKAMAETSHLQIVDGIA